MSSVQHIQSLAFEIDFNKHGLTCIVGKNGVGKTTLIKAIKNLSLADTFAKTSPNSIFTEQSEIKYTVGEEAFSFRFDPAISELNCKKVVPASIKQSVVVELPMPHGDRYNFFQSVVTADLEIRQRIVLQDYQRPDELIAFLNDIYSSTKFDNLKEIQVKKTKHYCVVLDNSRYIREDYLSSGEYSLIGLYRKISERRKLIVIDEIDNSLDAAAQAHLVRKLRELCQRYEVNVLFTTHSLAMMQTLDAGELLYMQADGGNVELISASYHYVKSILFGFAGSDKYILTEDVMLQEFLEFIIRKYCPRIFYSYKIIFVGPANCVTSLLDRNIREEFFSNGENVIGILDGDQSNEPHAQRSDTYCTPIASVEKALLVEYQKPSFPHRLPGNPTDARDVYKRLTKGRYMTQQEIFDYLCGAHAEPMRVFGTTLDRFLSEPT